MGAVIDTKEEGGIFTRLFDPEVICPPASPKEDYSLRSQTSLIFPPPRKVLHVSGLVNVFLDLLCPKSYY